MHNCIFTSLGPKRTQQKGFTVVFIFVSFYRGKTIKRLYIFYYTENLHTQQYSSHKLPQTIKEKSKRYHTHENIIARIVLFSKETKQQLFELLNVFELRTCTSLKSHLNVFGTAGITGFATVYEECFTLTTIAETWSI